MLPSMYSAISGLRANQKKLDVIGNNIANVSTTGFKVQRVVFQDMLSQTVGSASSAGQNTGGTNPKQVGLGVQIGSIDTLTSTGNMQSTGRNLDAAIDGKGYFLIGRGPTPATTAAGVIVDPATHLMTNANGMSVMFSRDGAFNLDDKGNLVTADGNRVLGYAMVDGTTNSVDYTAANTPPTINYVDPDKAGVVAGDTLVPLVIPDVVTTATGTKRVKTFSIEKDGLVKAVLDDGSVTALGQIAMASFKNEGGLTKLGKNLYQNSANSGAPVLRNGVGAAAANVNGNGYGDMLQNMLEMSNVDLAEQFTDMIVSSRAFQANGKMITTGDEILQELVNLKR